MGLQLTNPVDFRGIFNSCRNVRDRAAYARQLLGFVDSPEKLSAFFDAFVDGFENEDECHYCLDLKWEIEALQEKIEDLEERLEDLEECGSA